MSFNTIYDVMDKYVEVAKDYLSYSNSKEEENAEVQYIISNYNGSADEYAMDDLSVKEFVEQCLEYAFENVYNLISPLDYYKILQSVKDLDNPEIDDIIEDVVNAAPITSEKTGIEFIDHVQGKRDNYGNAVFEIMNILAPEYDSELTEFFIDMLQERVDRQ